MDTYTPVMEENKKVVKFTKEQLETLLDRLEESGARAIGVELKVEDEGYDNN